MSDTQALLYAIGIYLVGFGALFWNYGMFASVVVRWSKKPKVKPGTSKIKQPPLTAKETILSYIPGYQACLVRKSLYRKSGVLGVLMIISIVGMLLNLLNKFVLPINGYVMFFMNIFMFACLLLFYLTYAIITADCAHMYGFGWFTIILCFLLPHLFCWYLKNNIPSKMRQLHKEEIFREHHGDTVIKSKRNK